MPKARRGEIWIADLGMVAKVRPVLILSVGYEENERAVITYVLRTTSCRGTRYEVPHSGRAMPAGAFDAQGIFDSRRETRPSIGRCGLEYRGQSRRRGAGLAGALSISNLALNTGGAKLHSDHCLASGAVPECYESSYGSR